MDRDFFYSIMNGEGTLDYELYLNYENAAFLPKRFQGFLQRRRVAIPNRPPGGRNVDEADWIHAARHR